MSVLACAHNQKAMGPECLTFWVAIGLDTNMAGFKPPHEHQDTKALPISRPEATFLEDGNQYVIDCVRSVEDLEKLRSAWQALERSTSQPYIYFQSFDWVLEWCRIHCANSESPSPSMRIYILLRNNKLSMVWPLMASKSVTGLTNLCFLTEPHGQYGNVIVDENTVSVNTAKRLWQHIQKSPDIDAITLDQYPQNSFVRIVLEGSGIVENSHRHASILNLDGFEDWEEYTASLSKKQRKQRKQKRNKLAREGDIRYEVYYGGSTKYAELIALALEWKQEWLRETGRRATVLSQRSTFEFLSKLAGKPGNSQNAPEGAVLGVLTIDNVPLAIEIGFVLSRHYYCYLGAFDWAKREFSPGKIQMEESQQWAKEVGISKFDFLGDPADYKSSWTDEEDPFESRSVAVSWRGYVYSSLWKARLRPTVRKIFNDMSSENRARLLALLGIGKPSSENLPEVKADDGGEHLSSGSEIKKA